MKEINLNDWKRKSHFQFFAQMDYPQFNICFDIDITDLMSQVQSKKLPFYYTMIYLATLAANDIDEFKYRRREDRIILHDEVCPAFSAMSEGDDLFKMVTVEMESNLNDFVIKADEKSDSQKEHFIITDFIGHDEYIYITSIPWISFTHISHTINLNKNDSAPRISWGKYYSKRSKVYLPFSVQVNHCFADGYHIAQYKEILESYMTRIEEL
ncbi:MAG: chloramphenicol acetyltransferase [Spirochaetes bacterium]|nr:chloramphenicol acetyltransferase [Spirochaetota bacterium]